MSAKTGFFSDAFPYNVSIVGLFAGSQYSVSVFAVSADGTGPAASQLFWTEIDYPKIPEPPTLIRHRERTEDGTIRVKLHPVDDYFGPITSYLVIVLDESFPILFDNNTLYNYTKAKAEGLHYWITAELEPSQLSTMDEFVIGDNRVYRNYLNYGPLRDHDFHVSVAAVSTLNGVTRTSFAKVSHDQHADANIIVFQFDNPDDHKDHEHEQNVQDNGPKPAEEFMDDHIDNHEHDNNEDHKHQLETEPEENDPTVTVLIVVLVVASILLLAALGFFAFIRYSVAKRFRRRRPDTQELTTHMPTIDPLENGYIDNEAYQADGQRSAEDYLQSLDGKVWQIPRNFVDVQNEVMGRGRFGTVMKGTVNLNQESVVCNVYIVPNKMMDRAERQHMLRDLDQNIKAKINENIINLIGICEEQDTTLLVLDPLEMELKQFLLDSRSIDTHPSYAQKSDRFSNIREEDVLGIMVGVAEGLDHLTHSGVQVKQLSSRMVYLSGGYRPKIFGFGIADYSRRTRGLDLTRWNAPETLLKNQYSCKSAVWSYGCLLWELATLGQYKHELILLFTRSYFFHLNSAFFVDNLCVFQSIFVFKSRKIFCYRWS